MSEKTGVALYSAVDARLTHYAVDVAGGTLAARDIIELPAKVQYAWPHPTHRILYVATSSGGPGVPSDRNHVTALTIANDGSLRPHGEVRTLLRRAVHLCVDPAGEQVFSAHNFGGGGMTIHPIEPDGTLGVPVPQDDELAYGNYPHQVMVFPAGDRVLVVDRGINAKADAPEAPGALRSFGLDSGRLVPDQVVAPGGGFGFGPRHVVFHPTRPWLYVSDERTNKLRVFVCPNGRVEPTPAFVCDTLAEPDKVRPRQLAGPIHIHPNGKFVYVANRSDHGAAAGAPFRGGENNIAIFAIDEVSGAPTLVQHAPTRSIHVRTFSIDPGGHLLVAASIMGLDIAEEGRTRHVPAGLSVFKVGTDGTLSFLHRQDVETNGDERHYWSGMVGLS